MVARPTRKRMYRTMQGRMVDIEKLRASNEHVRAVGNMNVNARGDVLGPSGRIIESKADVITKYYEQPKGKADDTPIRRKIPADRKIAPTPQPSIQRMTPTASKPDAPTVITTPEKKGIDAALDGLE
jgi:hypothetical protein